MKEPTPPPVEDESDDEELEVEPIIVDGEILHGFIKWRYLQQGNTGSSERAKMVHTIF